MGIFKKLLVLSMIPVSVTMATGNEIEEGLLRRKLNHNHLSISSFFRGGQYRKSVCEALNGLKMESGISSNVLNQLDLRSVESTIMKQTREPYERKIDILSEELNQTMSKNAELYKQINRLKNPIYARSRFFGAGALTGILLTNAYMIGKSYYLYLKDNW